MGNDHSEFLKVFFKGSDHSEFLIVLVGLSLKGFALVMEIVVKWDFKFLFVYFHGLPFGN